MPDVGIIDAVDTKGPSSQTSNGTGALPFTGAVRELERSGGQRALISTRGGGPGTGTLIEL
jgi:hypothetical protein